MPIRLKCKCGKQLQTPDESAGKKVKCPACGEVVQIPTAAGAATDAEKVVVKCDCGRAVSVSSALAGKAVKCPGCGKALKIPAGKAKDATAATSSSPAAKSPVEELFDEMGIGVRLLGSGRRCQECRAPMEDEAIICIECGYNEQLGRKMRTARPVTQSDRSRKSKR